MRPDDQKPTLIVHAADLPATTYALRDLFVAAGELFDRGRMLTRLVTDAEGQVWGQQMAITNIVMAAHDICRPVKIDDKGDIRPITLPDRVARMYLELGDWGVRPLAGVTTSPIIRSDGSILAERGYDAATQMFVDVPPSGIDVPKQPSEDDAKAALLVLRQAFQTFPFADAAMKRQGSIDVIDLARPPGLHESSYLATVLTAIARPSLWTAPGVLIVAPLLSGSGAGKGMLVRAAATIAYGVAPKPYTRGHDKAEFDKRLVAALLGGTATVFIDNVNGAELGSETLTSVLTERPSQVRVMGASTMLPLNSAAFIACTGNGLKVTQDLARRFLFVEIDPRVEDPEARPFKPGFLDGIRAGRGALLSAGLTILRFGRIHAASLKSGLALGSFEQWCEWVRDPLLTLGCTDPVEGTRKAKEADPERREIAELFTVWRQCHGDEPVAAKDLDERVLILINPQKRARQFVTRALQRMAGTRHAGFVLTESKGGKWSAPTFALLGKGLETPERTETPEYKSSFARDERHGTTARHGENANGASDAEYSGVSGVSSDDAHRDHHLRDQRINRMIARRCKWRRNRRATVH
jgi:hypothetical protein